MPALRLLAACSFAAAALAWVAGSASGSLAAFRTPSGNIGCIYAAGGGLRTTLRCDIRSRLRPRPTKPRKCDLDWGDSYTMNVLGRVVVSCHGDTAILPKSRFLRYGTRWRHGGFTCLSQRAGLRCLNAGGHGFFMSRARSYRF